MTLAFRQSAADRIAELENEVDWLRHQLGIRDEQRNELAAGLGIPPQAARLLAVLNANPTCWMLRDWLDDQLPLCYSTEKRYGNNIQVYVSIIRKIVGRGVIETRGRGESYALRLTAAGAERVREALG